MIKSRFYLIRGDSKPIYVGFTNRTIKQRFAEHKADKDFSAYDRVTIEQLDKLEYDFTWDEDVLYKNANEVSVREAQLVEEYGTQDSPYQKADGGGQVWTYEKWFVRTNKDNPKYKDIDMGILDLYINLIKERDLKIKNLFFNKKDRLSHIDYKKFIRNKMKESKYNQNYIFNSQKQRINYLIKSIYEKKRYRHIPGLAAAVAPYYLYTHNIFINSSTEEKILSCLKLFVDKKNKQLEHYIYRKMMLFKNVNSIKSVNTSNSMNIPNIWVDLNDYIKKIEDKEIFIIKHIQEHNQEKKIIKLEHIIANNYRKIRYEKNRLLKTEKYTRDSDFNNGLINCETIFENYFNKFYYDVEDKVSSMYMNILIKIGNNVIIHMNRPNSKSVKSNIQNVHLDNFDINKIVRQCLLFRV